MAFSPCADDSRHEFRGRFTHSSLDCPSRSRRRQWGNRDRARVISLALNYPPARELFSYESRGVDIVWAVRHTSISATFVDAGAAEFFRPLLETPSSSAQTAGISKRCKYTLDGDHWKQDGELGCALGPDWAIGLDAAPGLFSVASTTPFLANCMHLFPEQTRPRALQRGTARYQP
jgi:hypothetical protein